MHDLATGLSEAQLRVPGQRRRHAMTHVGAGGQGGGQGAGLQVAALLDGDHALGLHPQRVHQIYTQSLACHSRIKHLRTVCQQKSKR